MALMFSRPRVVIEGVTIWARLPIPIRIGPTSSPLAFSFSAFLTPSITTRGLLNMSVIAGTPVGHYK